MTGLLLGQPSVADWRFLARQVREGRLRVVRDGGSVSKFIEQLERLATASVSGCQRGSNLACSCGSDDAAPMTAKLLTYEQVSQVLSCSVPTVKRLVAGRDLPTVKVGDSLVRVRTEDVDAYISRIAKVGAA